MFFQTLTVSTICRQFEKQPFCSSLAFFLGGISTRATKSLPFLGDIAYIFSGSAEEQFDQQHNSPQFSNHWVTGRAAGLTYFSWQF